MVNLVVWLGDGIGLLSCQELKFLSTYLRDWCYDNGRRRRFFDRVILVITRGLVKGCRRSCLGDVVVGGIH